MIRPFHMAWFFGGSTVQSWGNPWSGAIGRDWATGALHIDVARAHELYVRTALGTPRLDPSMLAPYMLQATDRIGIVPTVSTFAYHPYLLARQLGSLDHLSRGRAGWNIVTGSADQAVQNFGFDRMEDHDKRYSVAAEFTDATFALWDSWERDAILADEASGVFADHTKIHRVDFVGERYRSRGPLNIGPTPQGHPVMAQAGTSPAGRQFAAQYADTMIGDTGTVERMKTFREDVRTRMEGFGRDPDSCKILYIATFTLGATEEEARERLRQKELAAEREAPMHLATISKMTGIDFGEFPLDVPLESDTPLETNGTRLILDDFLVRNEGRTLRQAAAAHAVRYVPGGTAHFVGTLDAVAGRMCEVMEEVGGDGFLCASPEVSRRSIAEVADGLVPLLQRRGATRREYGHERLRDNLLDF
jgi:FMN-dependent oxidoreductase (nitrilotriacetate monooxygenase family)